MPTYQTLLPENTYPFLEEMSGLYSGIKRDMHVALMHGKSISVVEKTLSTKWKVDSTTVRNVYHDLKGNLSGIRELRKTQVKNLKSTIKCISSAIKKRLSKKQVTQKDRFIIHQKKRRLAIKQQKLKALQGSPISLCFGTKKLFKAQFNLEVNGYSSHDEWLQDWRKSRQSNFMMVGAKTYASGNQLCRLTSNGELKITVPPCLIKKFGTHISIVNIKFNYGQTFIDIALTPTRQNRGNSYRNGTEKAVTHRFVRKNEKWYLHTTVELPDIPWISHRNNGAIGIDLNVDSIAWAYCDGQGNLAAAGQINIDLKNKSSGQTTDILSKAIGQITDLAVELECPIVIEKLDFASKKNRLREGGKRYAKMLSQFAYSKFADLVQSKAHLKAIRVISVNPAYSSLIGQTRMRQFVVFDDWQAFGLRVKYMSLYGLNSGTSAALVLARRSLRFSERLPRFFLALFAPVDVNKHVWSYWAKVSKLTKGCLRHSYFAMRVRVGVKSDSQSSIMSRKLLDKSNDTPKILSESLCLDSCLPKFTQLASDFK